MQRYILKNKNTIIVVSFILIIVSLIGKWIFKLHENIIFNFHVFNFEYKINIVDIPLGVASIIGALPIFIQAFQALRVKVVSIDLLVTIAVLGAFLIKNFEESAIVTFLFLFGAYLEQKTLIKTRSAIKELTEMAPQTAFKKDENNNYVEVDIDDVDKGDYLLVKTGDKVPVDGLVINGEGSINEASITGESFPVTKRVNSNVFAGTILENGTLEIVAEKVGEDTTFGKIIELVEEAQDTKSDTERFIDKFAKYYTPFVLVASILVGIIFKDIELAITILVLGCPGALVIGVPVSNVAGIGNGARHGILLKGSQTITDFSKVDTFVFDKTGTLTIGKPEVGFVKYYDNHPNVKAYLLAVEKESTHPLALSIIDYLGKQEIFSTKETNVIKGMGIESIVNNKKILIGNKKLMIHKEVNLSNEAINQIKELETLGNSVVIMAVDNNLKLIMGIKDQLRPNINEEFELLRKRGIKNFILLSGDNQGAVDIVANELNITEAYGNMLPEDKANFVKELQSKKRKVAFIGDGINDSPSLATANIGIAMGEGTDVAIETGDVVLINSNITKLSHALMLAKKTANNMKQNIFISLAVVLLLLSAVIFSDWMNMSLGMFIHEGSILVVILNGMRLLKYKINKGVK